MDHATLTRQLTPWLIELFGHASLGPSSQRDGPDPMSVTYRELQRLSEHPQLSELLRAPVPDRRAIEATLQVLLEQQVPVSSLELLSATMAGDWRPIESGRRMAGTTAFLKRQVAGFLVLLVIAAVVIVGDALVDEWDGALSLLELFVVVTLSFFPGWLFIRFIGFRAGAVWDEYVLNLHRLGVDRPQHLPRPPTNSVYYERWVAAGGPLLARQPSIYQEKFDAYYGRSVSRSRGGAVRTEALFPMFLATAVLAVGWTAVLWEDDVFVRGPEHALDLMAIGFLGAYAFMVQMLVRRYFQGDLKASAYATSVLRIALAVGVVGVLHQAGAIEAEPGWQVAVAFVVGSFPPAGMQALQALAAKGLKRFVPVLDFPHPLSDVEGLNIWYEARLLEEGIEDMENLVTANLAEVMLHTRVPVCRLVDWIDQAYLFLHLPPIAPKNRKNTNADHPRSVLRRIGVRNASSFDAAFPLQRTDDGRYSLREDAADAVEAVGDHLSPKQLSTLARVLAEEPGLGLVRNWRDWEAPFRDAQIATVSAATTALTTESANTHISSSVRS